MTLAVDGVMCGNCEGKVKKALESVRGVSSADVDWEAETAVVYGEAGMAGMAELIDAVECTGKDAAAMVTLLLAVERMVCLNCEGKVRGVLEALRGVRVAVVDWEAGTAVVTGSMAADVAVDAVEDTGKDAALVTMVKLDVVGMMCGNCEAKVQAALSAVTGMREAVVDWEAGTAVVTSTVVDAQLVDAVEDTGKDASLASEEPYTPPSDARPGGGSARAPVAKEFKAIGGRGVTCTVQLPGQARPMAVSKNHEICI